MRSLPQTGGREAQIEPVVAFFTFKCIYRVFLNKENPSPIKGSEVYLRCVSVRYAQVIYGGLDLAVLDVFPDARICWFAENNPYAADVLKTRFPGIPNHGDVTTIAPWALEPVDMITAGFPCQDISRAGARAGLLRGNRTGLWHHVARLIRDLNPGYVFLENVDAIFTADSDSMVEPCSWCVGDKSAEPVLSALECVLSDLAEIGYDAEWTTLPASDVGAPHRRERWFCLAFPYSYGTRLERHPRGQRADGFPPEGGFQAA